jgi:hypothetical protein
MGKRWDELVASFEVKRPNYTPIERTYLVEVAHGTRRHGRRAES